MPEFPVIAVSTYVPSSLQLREAELAKQTSGTGKMDLQKLDKAATEFEAILLGQWLNEAQQSFSSLPGSDEEHDDPGYSQWQSLGMQELSKSLAASGGLGIAKMIRDHYRRTAADGETPEATAGAENAVPGGANAAPAGLNNGNSNNGNN